MIDSVHEINKIIQDDGYVQISNNNILPGDVILYYADDNEIEHSGIVIRSPQPPLFIPQVISKWGSYKELIHYANSCPYNYSNAKFYRLRD
jgi:hypothetical protein